MRGLISTHSTSYTLPTLSIFQSSLETTKHYTNVQHYHWHYYMQERGSRQLPLDRPLSPPFRLVQTLAVILADMGSIALSAHHRGTKITSGSTLVTRHFSQIKGI